MAHPVPSKDQTPPSQSSCGDCRHGHHIAFAITTIIGLGLLLSGVLGLKNVSFFGAMGPQVAFWLTVGGGGLLGLSLVLYLVSLCSRNQEAETTTPPQHLPPKPKTPVQLPKSIKNEQNIPEDPPRADGPPQVKQDPQPLQQDPLIVPPQPTKPAEPEAESDIPQGLAQVDGPPQVKQDPEQPQLQEQKRKQIISSTFYEGFRGPSIIDSVKDKIPLPTKKGAADLATLEIEIKTFNKKMTNLYCGLLAGNVTLIIDNRKEVVTYKGQVPFCLVHLARSYVAKHIEEFNKLINPCYAINIDDFFEEFEIEEDFWPEKILKNQMAAYMTSAADRRLGLLKENASPWTAKRCTQIIDGIEKEFSTIKQRITDQNSVMINLPCGMLDLSAPFAELEALEKLLKLPFMMAELIHSQGNIEVKIENLAKFLDNLSTVNELLWSRYPGFRFEMNKIFINMGVGFILNLISLISKDEYEYQKTLIDSAFELIVKKLEIEEVLAKQLMDLFAMAAVAHFPCGLVTQVEMLSDFAKNLTDSDKTIWDRYPAIRHAMIKNLNALAIGFISNQRSSKIDAAFDMIVRKLKIEKALEKQLKLLFEMVDVIHFRGKIDEQIDKLSAFVTKLTEPKDPIWDQYPEIKCEMIKNLNSMAEGFISNHVFLKCNPQDEMRFVLLKSSFTTIALKLGTDEPQFEIVDEPQTKESIAADAKRAIEEDRRLNPWKYQ
jgi:hypothetical protein